MTKPRRKIGRFHTFRLRKKRVAALLEAMKTGQSQHAAAALAGIPWGTMNRWMTEGSEAKSGDLRQFYLDVMEARNVGEATNFALVHKAAQSPQNWTAAAWILERCYGYVRRDQVTHQGPNGEALPAAAQIVVYLPANGRSEPLALPVSTNGHASIALALPDNARQANGNGHHDADGA